MSKKIFRNISIPSLAFLLPAIAFAQPSAGLGGIGSTINTGMGFLNGTLVPLVFALSFFMFLWGMFTYFFLSHASEEGREGGKQLMLWAVIAFVMMVSIWGLVNVVAQGLGFRQDSLQQIPNGPTTR